MAGSDSRTLADAVVDATRLCSRAGRGRPLILIDTRPSSDYDRRELDAIPLAAVARIDATRGECLGVRRFGEHGRSGAAEIYTDRFESEPARAEEVPAVERLPCEAEIDPPSSR